MNTQQTSRPSHDTDGPAPSPTSSSPDKAKKLDLSVSQVVGGALAAMTAAAVGSRLGVAGTLVGAAVASVVAGIAGALYTASLQHTRERVVTVLRTDRRGSTALAESAPTADLKQPRPSSRAHPSTVRQRLPKLPWKPVVAVAAAAFALAAGAITGIELLTGSALSGGSGTTVERVSRPEVRQRQPSPAGQTNPTPLASPSEAASTEPTAADEPTSTASTTAPVPTPKLEASSTMPEAPQQTPEMAPPTGPPQSEPTLTEPTPAPPTAEPTVPAPAQTEQPDEPQG